MDARTKRIRETIITSEAPLDHSVAWIDITDITQPLYKIWLNGEWVTIAGGGVPPTPTVKTLVNAYYYGATNEQFINDEDLPQRVIGLSSTHQQSVSANFNKVYFYIATASDQRIVSVIATSQEDQKDGFTQFGQVTINGLVYTVWEYTLDSGLPLDMTCTIRITGTLN